MNKLLYFSLFLFGFASSCTGPDESPKALVNIFLIDAPAKWDSVVVEIQGVELDFVPNGREGTLEKIYFPYQLEDKEINLSQLVGGAVLQLGRKELNLGTITGATLRLGTKNTLFQGDKGFPLALPQGQSDYSAEISLDLQPGVSYDLIVDFDLEKSVRQKSNSPISFDFRPTLNITSDIGNGDIQGTLFPTTLSPAIFAIRGTDSISTHINSSGTYLFRIPAGTYKLYIDPKNSGYNPISIQSVEVVERERTTLDRITLIKK